MFTLVVDDVPVIRAPDSQKYLDRNNQLASIESSMPTLIPPITFDQVWIAWTLKRFNVWLAVTDW